MIIDPRMGGMSTSEREMALARWTAGTGGTIGMLDSGDFRIDGQGPDGPCYVGVEFKTVGDLLSSLDTGRLAGEQIPLLARTYPFRYLLVEGAWRGSPVEVVRGGHWVVTGWSMEGLLVLLDDICTQAGVRMLRTHDRAATYLQLRALEKAWSRPWDERSGLHVIYTPEPPPSFSRPTDLERVLFLVPGLGWKKARAAARYFTARDGSEGPHIRPSKVGVNDWMEIEGIGKTLAERAVKFFKAL